jgi:hypothetical protein
MTAGIMMIVGPYKLVGRVDGSVTLSADMPGQPAQALDVPAEKAEEFMQFLALVVAVDRLGNRVTEATP